MRKIPVVVLSLGALLALSLGWQGSASAQVPELQTAAVRTDQPLESGIGDFGFGKQIAGTYLMWAEWDPVTEPVFPIILTINADGTMVSTSSAALGRDDANLFLLRQNFHTTWEKTGPRELTTRHLLFMHSPPAGDLPSNGAPLLFITRTTGVWTFDEDLDGFSVQFVASIFLPTQLMGADLRDPNPNTTEAPAIGTFPSLPSTGKRLEVGD